MLFQSCWASVADGEPTLGQHWMKVLCLQVLAYTLTIQIKNRLIHLSKIAIIDCDNHDQDYSPS